MFKNVIIMAAVSLPFFVASSAVACTPYADERLQSYCLVGELNKFQLDSRLVGYVASLLRNQGYLDASLDGAELPGIQFSIRPNVQYSSNINGGNSRADLVLGGMVFEGDEDYFRKSGLLTGFNLGIGGRYVYGEGQYLNYTYSADYMYSFQHDIDVTSSSYKFCTINHIYNWWYVDFCADSSNTYRDLIIDNSENIEIKFNKFYELYGAYNQLNFSLNRFYSKEYFQNQVGFGLSAANSDGIYSSVDFLYGEQIPYKLATRYDVKASLSFNFSGKPLYLGIQYTLSDGGKLLGYNRSDTSYRFTFSYPFWENSNLSLGYSLNDSTIDYFDTSTPELSINFLSKVF